MSTLSKTFDYSGRTVRTLTVGDQPWFVAADVCEVLEIKNSRSSLALLDDDETGVHTVDTNAGIREVATVNEAGLYTLILKSRKHEAKKFKRWVTHEVLPSLRRTGMYIMPSPDESALVAGAAQMMQEFSHLKEIVAELVEDRNLARFEATALPEANGVLPGLTNADHIRGAASIISRITGAPMSAVWPLVWREFERRFKVRMSVRKKRAGYKGSTLNFAIMQGHADRVYNIIVDMLQRQLPRELPN